MAPMSGRWQSGLATIAALLAGAAIFWTATAGLRAFTTEAARRLDAEAGRIAVTDARLTDARDRDLRLHDGRLSLISFIYTNCPTICQTAGDDFHRLQAQLKQADLGGRVRLLSVSFDRARDDGPALTTYAEAHGADGSTWSVVRPDAAALPRLLRDFGVTVIPDEFGGFQHNAAIHVVTPAGRLVRILDPDDIEGALTAAKALVR